MENEQMTKVDGMSLDLIKENIERLGQLFPEAVKEGRVDYEALNDLLGNYQEPGEERYCLNWAGKADARREAQKRSSGTLRPCREESKDWDTTENLYIEGDNLEVLKLLQKSYHGRIKMIYIDPPYNTGKDFVYKDNYKDNLSNYLQQIGEDRSLSTKALSDSDGRFHSKWLSMMYPRLKLARNLLTEDGVMFVSINDYELDNLLKICSEIFGRHNMLACFSWRTDGNFDNQARIKTCHEYIVLYAKNEEKVSFPNAIDPNIPKTSKIFKEEIRNTIIKNGPKNPIEEVVIPVGFPSTEEDIIIEKKDVVWPKYSEDIVIREGKTQNEVVARTGWASRAQLIEFIENGYKPVKDTKGQDTTFGLTKTGAIETIKVRDNTSYVISVLNNMGGTQKATADMGELGNYFDYPKPLSLMMYLSKMYLGKDDIILDFFSGSATTAHAVMLMNANGGKRKYIMIQLPAATPDESEARKAGFTNICDLGKERIRRAGKKIKDDSPLTTQDLDVGFKVFKLDSSNVNVWDSNPDHLDDALEQSLFNIKTDRTEEDLLYEILLKYGMLLTVKVNEHEIAGKKVYEMGNGELIVCLAPEGLSVELAEGIGQLWESIKEQGEGNTKCRVVFQETGFYGEKGDEVKSNTLLTLKQHGIENVVTV